MWFEVLKMLSYFELPIRVHQMLNFHWFEVSHVSILFQPHALMGRIKGSTTEEEKDILTAITVACDLSATLLPIKTVGVQVSQP